MAQLNSQPTALQALQPAFADAPAAHSSSDAAASREANAAFHQAWKAMVPNQRLIHAIELYVGHVRYLRVLTLGSAAARKATLSGMKKIHAALRRHDGAAAERVMREHLGTARKFLRVELDAMERELRTENAVATPA